MGIVSGLRCQRCGQQRSKVRASGPYCARCMTRYTPEDLALWDTVRSQVPLCEYCRKTISGRAVTTILSGRVRFCSTTCRASAEKKIPERDWPDIVRLYRDEGMTTPAIALRYGCTYMIVVKGLRRCGVHIRPAGWSGDKNGMFGRTHTPEAREKIREANRRQFQREGARSRHAELTAQQLQEGRTGKSFNKLERAFAAMLDAMGIVYQWQAKLHRFVFDFLVYEAKLFLEVHGTFWHADPRFYNHAALKPTQERNRANDIRKAEAARAAGYRLLVLWEYDITTTPVLVTNQVRAAVEAGNKEKTTASLDVC